MVAGFELSKKGGIPKLVDARFGFHEIQTAKGEDMWYYDNDSDSKIWDAVFAVYDGHGGQLAAKFCEENLVESIMEEAQAIASKMKKGSVSTKHLEGLKDGWPLYLDQAIDKAFKRVDTDVKKQMPDGTTAVIVFLKGGDNGTTLIKTAWVGDSRAIMWTLPSGINKAGAGPFELSTDHKADDEVEMARITTHQRTKKTLEVGVPEDEPSKVAQWLENSVMVTAHYTAMNSTYNAIEEHAGEGSVRNADALLMTMKGHDGNSVRGGTAYSTVTGKEISSPGNSQGGTSVHGGSLYGGSHHGGSAHGGSHHGGTAHGGGDGSAEDISSPTGDTPGSSLGSFNAIIIADSVAEEEEKPMSPEGGEAPPFMRSASMPDGIGRSMSRSLSSPRQNMASTFVGKFKKKSVDGIPDEGVGPARVFNPKTGVSLAVTRSIGDRDAARSVIADPSIRNAIIPANTPARIVLASDGVWDVMDNDMVKRMGKGTDVGGVAVDLAKGALKGRGLAGKSPDDITLFCVEINAPAEALAAAKEAGSSGGCCVIC